MLEKLKNLIFGLEEFEKTKIEVRFELSLGILPSIEIRNLEDFETLEEVIYKIKEELRVKSSNINKTISNPSRKFRKKDVLDIIDKLSTIKYDFLKKAFSAIENISMKSVKPDSYLKDDNEGGVNSVRVDEGLENNSSDENIVPADFKEKEIENSDLESMIEEKKDEVSESLSENEVLEEELIYEDEVVRVIISGGKVAHMILNFKGENINYSYVKNFAGLFFEFMQAHGTNIIAEKNRVLIIPRFQEDGLFSLPVSKINVDEVYEKIKGKKIKVDVGELDEKKELKEEKKTEEKVEAEISKEKKIENDVDEEETENKEDYLEVEAEEKPERKKSLKSKEDSLDALLGEMEKTKKDLKPDPKPQFDSTKISYLKDDPIEVELKEKEEEEVPKEKEIEVEVKSEEDFEHERQESEFYRDDKIRAFINPECQILGEVIVERLDKKEIGGLDIADLSYMSLFSKAFSTALFEVMGAHGTNLIWDFSSSKLRIVPRFNEDGLNNLTWEPKSNTDDFLEQVRAKLLEVMNKEIQQGENKDLDVPKKAPVQKHKRTVEETNELKEKADVVLESLRRIP